MLNKVAIAEETQYEYDVFVSYSHMDNEWVWQELVPRLEKSGLRFLIDKRDFEPGAPISTEIERAILKSRKIILVLSPAYLEGEWTGYETALGQALDPAAHKRRLIPVMVKSCEPWLRIRPLLSINLTSGDSIQWKRLLTTLGSSTKTDTTVIQQLSLKLAEATSSGPQLRWELLGTTLLIVILVSLLLLISLVYVVLHDTPILGGLASILVAMVVSFLGLMGIREDREFGQRLATALGHSTPAQVFLAMALGTMGLLWIEVGWPILQERFGSGIIALAVGPWEDRSPGSLVKSPFVGSWTGGTRDALSEKFRVLGKPFRVHGEQSPQMTNEFKHNLDLWITGYFIRSASESSQVNKVALTARLYKRNAVYIRSVSVEKVIEKETLLVVMQLQNQLALKILGELSVRLDPETKRRISRIPTDKPEALARNNAGVEHLRNGRVDSAIEQLDIAITIDPEYSSAHNNLGYSYLMKKDFTAALGAFKAAIGLMPTNALYFYNLGFAYESKNELHEAVDAYQLAIKLDPNYAKAYNNLGNAQRERKQYAQAKESIQKGLLLVCSDRIRAKLHKNLGRVALDAGDIGMAKEELGRALHLDQNYPEGLYYLALAEEESGNPDVACEIWERYNAISTRDSQSRRLGTRDHQNALNCKLENMPNACP